MFKYKDVTIKVLKGDITEVSTEAIVNAANNTLLGGSGVDGAIHKKAGPSILEQCKRIGGCPTGEARITTAGNLPSQYIIHTVGPIYKDGNHNEGELLYSAYFNSLRLAKEYGLKTISFPSISTGAYGYPIEEAVGKVMNAIIDFLDKDNSIEQINFIMFSKKDYNIYIEYLTDLL